MPAVIRRRAACAAASSVAVVAALLAVLAPSATAQTRECFLLTHCTSVAGPWVVISPLGQQPIPAGSDLACPDGDPMQLPVGSDYELQGDFPTEPVVTRFMPGPGVGLINGSVGYFWALSLRANSSGAFRAHLGCIPRPAGAAPAAAQTDSATVVRTRTTRLRPSQTVRSTRRCHKGESLVRGLAGVRFHREEAPTALEVRHVALTHRTEGGRVRARVRTGPSVGDRERVTLQVLAFCER